MDVGAGISRSGRSKFRTCAGSELSIGVATTPVGGSGGVPHPDVTVRLDLTARFEKLLSRDEVYL